MVGILLRRGTGTKDVHAQRKKSSKDTARSQPSAKNGGRPQEKPALPQQHLNLRFPGSKTEKINFYYLRQSVVLYSGNPRG